MQERFPWPRACVLYIALEEEHEKVDQEKEEVEFEHDFICCNVG